MFTAIVKDIMGKVGKSVQVLPEGIDRYRVIMPFTFDDGDSLNIFLRKKAENKWLVSDEGNTLMRLSYNFDEKDLDGTRSKIISNSLIFSGVMDISGEFSIEIEKNNIADAIFSLSQAILKVMDVSFISREIVRSTFMQDLRFFFEKKLPENIKKDINWYHKDKDPHANYPADYRIVSSEKSIYYVFALPADDKVRDATISALQYEKWNLGGRIIGIFENQEDINRKVLARFSDVCDKQFSSFTDNIDRISRYICDVA